jgi:flagellar hook-associated protein 3 FlgL
MIPGLNPSAQQFLNNLGAIDQQMQQAQTELSTGLRVNQVSDAPDEVSAILEARASLSVTQQINTDLQSTTTEVNTGEQSLESAVTLFDQVQTLGAEGDTATATAASQADMGQQVNGILQQMVGLADTQVAGRYIFSGDSDQQQPYTIDTTQTPPVVSSYLGSATTRMAQHPDGSTFPVALTAQTIFDSSDPTTNVFSLIENLANALNSGDSSAIQTAVSGLSTVGDYLNQQLAFYGTTQDTVQEATNYGQTLQTQLQTQLSNLEDADSAGAIEQLTQAQTQDQAALQSEALLPRTTLFNFLG